jgi:hypothetical protein
MLSEIDCENPKPKKSKPDEEALSKLLGACMKYDMDEADEAMAEIEKYSYESEGGLVDFLREQFDMMKFDEIVERVNKYRKEELY